MHNDDNNWVSDFVFMIQVSSDLVNWSDTEMVFPDLSSACDFARHKSKGLFWNSLRVVRIERSVCCLFYSHSNTYKNG